MDEVDSVASPKTRPLAAAAMAEPVPTKLGTACMFAEGFYHEAETPPASILGQGNGDGENWRRMHRRTVDRSTVSPETMVSRSVSQAMQGGCERGGCIITTSAAVLLSDGDARRRLQLERKGGRCVGCGREKSTRPTNSALQINTLRRKRCL
jgi:hypothetical protein